LILVLALLSLTAARVMVALRVTSLAAFLLGAFLVAHAELLLLVLVLSLFRGVTAASLVMGAVIVCALTLWLSRGSRSGLAWRAAIRVGRLDPLLLTLAVVVALGFAYSVAMGIWVPQVEDDELTHHLVRAQLWWQHGGITYLHGIIDFRNNGYPPGGEVGPFVTMALAGNDYFVALDQIFAALALAVGAAGISRRLGFDRRQALFGGLLVLSLPIIALQVGTAMSDLVIGAFLLAAAFFLIDGHRWSPWIAGLAAALAMDVKLSAPLAIPAAPRPLLVGSTRDNASNAYRLCCRWNRTRRLLVCRQSGRDRNVGRPHVGQLSGRQEPSCDGGQDRATWNRVHRGSGSCRA